MKRRFLMTPGPSPVPLFVRESLSQEMMHHRTSEFKEILKKAHEGLKSIFCTENPVLVLSSSGTGAMEASVSNLFSKEDKVLAIGGGKFGERWAEIAKAFGLNVIEMNVGWGTAPSPDELTKILDDNKDIKAVLTTLCETSTATVFDVEKIAKITNEKDILLVVDAISGLGQDVLLTDQWGVDVVVSGSQKGLMLPPGLSFISLSRRAQNAIATSNLPKYYFDLKKALKSHANDDTPYTSAVSLIVGLATALEAIKKEGLEVRWKKFSKMAEATREAAKALGLETFSQSPSDSVTAIVSPENIKSSDIVKILRGEYGLSIAGGQADFKDKIFRIAHMGWISDKDLIECFLLLEKVLGGLGYEFEQGISKLRLEEVLYG
ncbi:MAG: alanine--glyoxylate aminotransferase family protein [Candidatus Omnitrophica bacterium]|nr:alanine--glyoxylate aminotransferase family protein [Candidatus Omnitrophota bacterium]